MNEQKELYILIQKYLSVKDFSRVTQVYEKQNLETFIEKDCIQFDVEAIIIHSIEDKLKLTEYPSTENIEKKLSELKIEIDNFLNKLTCLSELIINHNLENIEYQSSAFDLNIETLEFSPINNLIIYLKNLKQKDNTFEEIVNKISNIFEKIYEQLCITNNDFSKSVAICNLRTCIKKGKFNDYFKNYKNFKANKRSLQDRINRYKNKTIELNEIKNKQKLFIEELEKKINKKLLNYYDSYSLELTLKDIIDSFSQKMNN
jgi:hypothetical protein